MVRKLAWIVLMSTACGTTDELPPTDDNVQNLVFTPGCALSGCHDATSSVANLNLSTTADTLASLVDLPPVNTIAQENGWVLVEPGSPSAP